MKNLSELENLFAQFEFLREQCEEIICLQDKIKNNEVTVSVMGQFKRGKSSLINAMLNCDLLPVGIIPLTTVITEIRYAAEFKAFVCFEDGTEKTITLSQITDYCSEQNNPGNYKKVSKLKIYTPKHPFGEGIVIADTPGVGSVNAHNTTSSYDYISKSDVILFLLSVDSPVSESERDFLLNSHDFAAKFFFAINKTDNISVQDLNEFMAYCKSAISGYMKNDIEITPVSARTGAGIEELRLHISDEIKSFHSMLLQSSVEKKAEHICNNARSKLLLSIEAASATEDEITDKLTRVADREKEMSDFADELQILSDHKVQNLIGRISQSMDKTCVMLDKDLKTKGEELYNELKELNARSFEKEFHNSFDRLLVDELKVMNENGLSMLASGYEEIVSEIRDKAVDTALFISSILKDEFNIDYAFNIREFHVSEKSDFIMRTGFENKVMPDINSFNHLLPKKTANLRFYERSIEQGISDIGKNKNNMLYNYKYKMQESLRVLCMEMVKEICKMESELQHLKEYMHETLNMEEKTKAREILRAKDILEKI